MIISTQKDISKIIGLLEGHKSVFLVGCSECAALCGTGDEAALQRMKEELEKAGKKVTGMIVAKTGCQVLGTKVELKRLKEAVEDAEVYIAMSCGAGAQTLVELFRDKPVYTANDSLFLGNMTRFRHFDERCSLCGECIINHTGGICPVTTCPKGILNGPCGGVKDGKCEVSQEIDCCWVRIYERLKAIGQEDKMKKIHKPKNYSRHNRPASFLPAGRQG